MRLGLSLGMLAQSVIKGPAEGRNVAKHPESPEGVFIQRSPAGAVETPALPGTRVLGTPALPGTCVRGKCACGASECAYGASVPFRVQRDVFVIAVCLSL